jgi:uncharacterized protein CbrC (UPF0167 family)
MISKSQLAKYRSVVKRQRLKTSLEEDTDDVELTHSRICDWCSADIFNISFSCKMCRETLEVSHDLCPECVARGRGCVHANSKVYMLSYLKTDTILDLLSEANTVLTDSFNAIEGKVTEEFLEPVRAMRLALRTAAITPETHTMSYSLFQ